MLSNPQMNGFPEVELMPAMTGLTKNGPNRFSYSDELTRLASVWGAMLRSSRRRYMLTL